MAYIYQITNDINNKVYVGKTEDTIEKRFKQHCKDAFTRGREQRPLYAAMRKYGIQHFHIEIIEETNSPIEREIYWIEQKNSYHNGYNATLGGEGTKKVNDEQVIYYYKQLGNQKAVSAKLGIDVGTIRRILNANHVEINKYPTQIGNIVYAYTTKGDYIKQFSSHGEAARWLISERCTTMDSVDKVAANLGRAIDQKKRKTAFGFVWYSHEQ